MIKVFKKNLAPEPLWEAAQNGSVVPPKRGWYIGGTMFAIWQAAKAAGMTAVAVGYGYISEEDEHQELACRPVFTTVIELVSRSS